MLIRAEIRLLTPINPDSISTNSITTRDTVHYLERVQDDNGRLENARLMGKIVPQSRHEPLWRRPARESVRRLGSNGQPGGSRISARPNQRDRERISRREPPSVSIQRTL